MKRLITLLVLLPTLAFGFTYKNNSQTGKPDLVTTSIADIADTKTRFVPYSSAVYDVNLGTKSIKTPTVQASSSAGVTVKNNSGGSVALMGAGGGTGATFYGGTTFQSTVAAGASAHGDATVEIRSITGKPGLIHAYNQAAPSTEVFKVQDDGATTATSFTGDGQNLTLARIGSSTYSTLQDLQNVFHSAGYVSGGTMTDAGGATINVAAGTGLIRSTNTATGQVLYFDWPASNGLAITADSIRYVGVEYNSGTPQVTVRTSMNWNYRTDFPLGRVVNEGGTLHIMPDPQAVGDHASTMIQREYATMPLAYDVRTGGLTLGETGTRNVTLSAGSLWDRLNQFSIGAINTSGADRFDAYYRNGSGGFTKVASQSQWPNTQYDDGTGVLATMTAARYANLWFYVETDGGLVMLYGRNQYTTLAAALAGTEPATVPNRITAHGRLIGRIVFQKSAGTASEIDSAFTTVLATTGVTNHANLSNLDYASAGHTGFEPAITAGTSAQFVRGDKSVSALASGDIPNNAANTSGTSGGLSGTPNITVGTIGSGAITVSGAGLFSPAQTWQTSSNSQISILLKKSNQQWLMGADVLNAGGTDFFVYDNTNNATVLKILSTSGNATFSGTVTAGGGSANTVACWKTDGKTLGYATVAEITAGTCH